MSARTFTIVKVRTALTKAIDEFELCAAILVKLQAIAVVSATDRGFERVRRALPLASSYASPRIVDRKVDCQLMRF
jgi:hypothetical protein